MNAEIRVLSLAPGMMIPAVHWNDILSHSELLVRSRYGLSQPVFVSFYYFKEQNFFLCQVGTTMISQPILLVLHARSHEEFKREVTAPQFMQMIIRRSAVEHTLNLFRESLN